MNVLAIGCHPDDIEINCAGTLPKCVKREDNVTVCRVCNGILGHVIISGCDGALSRGMQWQGMTLHYGPTPWIASSYIPTLPGKLFFLNELAGPLNAECN